MPNLMYLKVSVSYLRLTLLLCFLLVLGACSSNKKVDLNKPEPLQKIKNQVNIKKLWSSNIGAVEKQFFFKPHLSSDTANIYVGNNNKIIAIDKQRGRKVWQQRFKTQLTGTTGIGGNLVFAGDENGNIYALDKATGRLIWTSTVSSEVLAPPQGNGDIVVVASSDGKIFGLNADNGSERWRVDTVKPILLRSGSSAPVIADDMVYLAQDNGKVLAITNFDGVRRWEARVAIPKGDNELERLVDIDGSPLYHNGSLYAVSYQGGLMSIDLKTGRPIWVKPASSSNDIGVYGGMLVVVNTDATVTAYNSADGSEIWTNEVLKNRGLGSAQVTQDFVTTVDYKGYLHVLDRTTGNLMGRKKIGKKGANTPMLREENTIYVLDISGKLQALLVSE